MHMKSRKMVLMISSRFCFEFFFPKARAGKNNRNESSRSFGGWMSKIKASARLAAQSCLTVCDSLNCSPPGSSVHGILQARILSVAMPFSRRSP